jgi:hypothetical protein
MTRAFTSTGGRIGSNLPETLTMTMMPRTGLRYAVGAAAMIIVLLAGCGGGSSSTPSPASSGSGGSQPATIQGIATPTTVAVVTATHAN